jgi:hypothetical protein
MQAGSADAKSSSSSGSNALSTVSTDAMGLVLEFLRYADWSALLRTCRAVRRSVTLCEVTIDVNARRPETAEFDEAEEEQVEDEVELNDDDKQEEDSEAGAAADQFVLFVKQFPHTKVLKLAG